MYLSTLAFNARDFGPFFDGLSQVDLAERHFDFANLVVFGEAVTIVNSKNKSLGHGLSIR